MSTVAKQPMYRWNALRWPKIQRDVFKLLTRSIKPRVVVMSNESDNSNGSCSDRGQRGYSPCGE